MKRFWFFVLGCGMLLSAFAQEKKYSMYAVGFYNLENLFDTIHDEGKMTMSTCRREQDAGTV